MKFRLFNKPLVITTAVVAFLFLAVLIGTPYLIDLSLERWIASQGPQNGEIENIDFNPFSGRLELDNLKVETKRGRTLTVPHAYLIFSWKQLFKKRLYIKELMFRDMYMLIDTLDDRGLRVGGLIIQELIEAEEKPDESGWGLSVDSFVLQNAEIEYDTPEVQATYFIESYTLTGLETWNKDKPVKMAFAGRLNESPVRVEAEVMPLGDIKSWDGRLVLEEGSLGLVSEVRGLQQYDPAGTVELDLQLDARLQENGAITVSADGKVTLSKLQFRYKDYDLQQGKIAWQGRITGNIAADQGLELKAQGELAGDELLLAKSADPLSLKLGAFSWQGKARVGSGTDAGITLEDESTLALDKLQFRDEEYDLQQEKVTWQGNITGSITAAEKSAGTAAGKLAGTGLKLADRGHARQLTIGVLNWQGKAGVTPGEESSALTMESSLAGDDVRIHDLRNNLLLLGLEKFNIPEVRIAGSDDIRVSQVDLQMLRLAEKKDSTDNEPEAVPPLVQASALTIAAVNLQSGSDLSIDTMQLNDLQSYIHRSKDSSWQIIPALLESIEATPAEPELKPEKKDAAAKPFRLQLNKLQTGGSCFIDFADNSLERPFSTIFYINEFELAEIDTDGAAAPARFDLQGQVGDYGSVSFAGTFKPGEDPLTLDLQGSVQALGMVPLSSYTGRTIGYDFTSGKMDADVTMDIDKGVIDGEFALRMRNLEVARVNPDVIPKIDNRLDMPLESALSMLRDNNDVVSLDIELTGDIKNPDFGFQDAINQALAKAMKFAALSYFKYTLQPFGTYIAIAEVIGKAGKEITKVKLDPVSFPAGDATLNDEARLYLEKIAEVLHNRPELAVELCGKAVAEDRLFLLEQRKKKQADGKEGDKKEEQATVEPPSAAVLLNLAEMRAAKVKEILVKQHDINHDRLYLCLPEIVDSPDQEPVVELLID